MKKHAGHKNLKPISSTEQAKRLGSLGGKARAERHKAKSKQFQELCKMLGIEKGKNRITIEEMREAIELIWATEKEKIEKLWNDPKTPLFVMTAIRECRKNSSVAMHRIIGCPTQKIENTGKNGEPIMPNIVINIAREELMNIVKKLNEDV